MSRLPQQSQSLPAIDLIPTIEGAVVIGCDGTYRCEFLSVNDKQLIDEVTHQPIAPAVIATKTAQDKPANQTIKPQLIRAEQTEQSYIKDNHNQGKPSSSYPASRYYVQVPAGQHELLVLFYPEDNLQYKERFALIHHFGEGGKYRLHAYRQDNVNGSGSLLDNASPPPLCVEVLNHNTLEKKFCKQVNELNHDEFSEVAKSHR